MNPQANKVQEGIVVIALVLGAFALGRHSGETKVQTVIKTVEIEKIVDKDQHSVTKIVAHPDGTKETTITKDTSTHSDTNTDSRSTNVTKISTSKHEWTLTALAGTSLNLTSPVIYGGSITKSVLGPISVGVWGLTSGTIGASIGIDF